MSSATLTDVSGLSLSSADRLCDDCRNMGHKIRQLCEVEGFTIPKPGALVRRSRSTCAFCEMIISRHWRLWQNEREWIISKDTEWRKEDFRPTNGIDGLMVILEPQELPRSRGQRPGIELVVLTTEG